MPPVLPTKPWLQPSETFSDPGYPPQWRGLQYQGQGSDGNNQQQHLRVGNGNVRGPSTGVALTQDTIAQVKE